LKLLMHLTALPDAHHYQGYADLAAAQTEGEHYTVTVRHRPGARVAVLAPHGGRIEDGTSEIARAIAADDHHYYLLEGRRPSHNYHTLHLTSHRFDEPRCLSLLAAAERVVAVHGCRGDRHQVYVGGRDTELVAVVTASLLARGIEALDTDHPFPGRHRHNICNRGRRGRGLQLEITHPLRRSSQAGDVAAAVRESLQAILALDDGGDAVDAAAL
jgi:phage replication-related protein YjqB (UPF0714/DUF867 family)